MMIYDRWIKYDIYVNIYIYGDDEDDGDDDDDDGDYDYDFDYDDDDELTWRDNCIWVGYASNNQPIWEYLSDFIECKKIGVAETHSFKTWK